MDEIDRKAYEGAMNRFYENKSTLDSGKQKTSPIAEERPIAQNTTLPPQMGRNDVQEFERRASQNTDPDLTVSYEMVKLPSKGLFYPNQISEVMVEHMTSKDEDVLSTYSLIENGTVF